MEVPESLGLFQCWMRKNRHKNLYGCWFCFLSAYAPSSQLLPPYNIKSKCPAFTPAGSAPHSTPCSAPCSRGEGASPGFQHGAAQKQMSWQGEAGGLTLQMSQPGIQLPREQASTEGVQIKISQNLLFGQDMISWRQ